MNKITNLTELRNDALKVYEQLRNKEIGIQEAKEASNVFGKIISSCKAQLEYNKYTGSKNPIDFMAGH
jgi:hypothetical protein